MVGRREAHTTCCCEAAGGVLACLTSSSAVGARACVTALISLCAALLAW